MMSRNTRWWKNTIILLCIIHGLLSQNSTSFFSVTMFCSILIKTRKGKSIYFSFVYVTKDNLDYVCPIQLTTTISGQVPISTQIYCCAYYIVSKLAIIHWLSQIWGSLKIHRIQKVVNHRTSHRQIKIWDALYILAQCTETCITTNVTATRDTSVLTDSSRDCTKA